MKLTPTHINEMVSMKAHQHSHLHSDVATLSQLKVGTSVPIIIRRDAFWPRFKDHECKYVCVNVNVCVSLHSCRCALVCVCAYSEADKYSNPYTFTYLIQYFKAFAPSK